MDVKWITKENYYHMDKMEEKFCSDNRALSMISIASGISTALFYHKLLCRIYCNGKKQCFAGFKGLD